MGTTRKLDVRKYSTLVQWSDEDREFVATSAEFEGLSGVGHTPEEAIAVLREAIEMAVEVFEDEGRALPAPRLSSDYSGQFRLRVPKHLHAALAAAAESEGVSLNTLAISLLSAGVAQAHGRSKRSMIR